MALFALFTQLGSSVALASESPSVATDEVSYDPGTTVTVSGSGFDAGSTLTVVVTRPDGSVVTGDGSETSGSDDVVADAGGGFTYAYILPMDISGVYDVDVKDANGTTLASTFFYDSHYRGGTIKWVRAPGGRVVTFTITSAWANSPGHVLNFGDGGSTNVSGGTPIATNSDYVVHRYEIVHDYGVAGDGPFTATYSDCCRIAGVQNSSDGFKATTVVDLGSGNDSSPVSGVPFIVPFVHGALNTINLAAADPAGDPFTFRLGTATEAGGTYSTPTAGGLALTISSAGLMSWNTASTTVDQLWTVHAVIEETGNSSTTDLDFFVKIVDGSANAPPTAAVDNVSTDFTLTEGVPFSVTITGSDSDGDALTINHLGLPTGSSLSPVATTQNAQPFTGTFSWTPGSGDVGSSNVVTISFSDPGGLQAFASFTVTVNAVPDADLSVAITAAPTVALVGQTLTYTVTASNAGPDNASTVTVTDTLASSVTFVSATTGCNEVSGTVTCTASSIANGASAAFDIVVTAPSSFGTISNSATVSASSPSDSVSGNNSATLNTSVSSPPGVPGVTTWGMGVLALMLGTGAVFMRRRRATGFGA
jgi:uncharacterized repeat protein (TIGR01451 family)